jgi:hypothetical protein
MPSIESFLSVVRSKGLARTEKFSVNIYPPESVPLPDDRQLITLFCEEASFPGKTIITRPARIHNLNIQRPSSVDFFGESANFTFFIDSEWRVKEFFDTWMNNIIGTTREISPYKSIIGTIEVNAIHEGPLDENPLEEYKETTRYKVKLHDAFPKTMNLMQTSYSNVGIHRVNIGFAYKYWTVENPDTEATPTPFINPSIDVFQT